MICILLSDCCTVVTCQTGSATDVAVMNSFNTFPSETYTWSYAYGFILIGK